MIYFMAITRDLYVLIDKDLLCFYYNKNICDYDKEFKTRFKEVLR